MTKALLIILLLPLTVFGQVTITGKVINRSDGKPVANASVFLSNATVGDKTTDQGTFKLQGVKGGQYNLVVSIVGYETHKQTITVGGSDIILPDIAIDQKTIDLEAVTIKVQKKDRKRDAYFEKFKKEFLGSGEFAGDCKIINPEMLDFKFDADSNRLTASSVDFLVIENKALGYKIKYLLNDFLLDNSRPNIKIFHYNGYILFEELKGTSLQEKDWQKHRSEAYENSPMHFLRAVINNRIEEEGFKVIRVPMKFNYSPDKVFYVGGDLLKDVKDRKLLIEGPDRTGIYSLFSKSDRLYIRYNKHRHFSDELYGALGNEGNTLVSFTEQNAFFDQNGTVINAPSLIYDGSWARKGIADILPVDYVAPNAVKMIAETAQINKIEAKLKAWSDSVKTEKAYLHFDKPFYAAGDTIYFKAYVTQGGQHKPSALSGILHAELIGPDSKIKKTVSLRLNDGIGWGDITLSDTLKGGAYRIRAYTNLMRNSSDPGFFEQEIPVGSIGLVRVPESGRVNNSKGQSTPVANKIDVQFLPEGGSLIAGNYSKIAFKAVASGGSGTEIKGVVTDDTGEQVCDFASTHLGMGVFSMVAHEGRTYKANITYADGSTGTIDLPKVVNIGYTINLNSTADTIRLRISAGSGSVIDKLSLIGQSGGVVYYAGENIPGAKFFTAVIPANRFPTGIVQFTLFNAASEPLNERLVFVNNEADQLKLKINANAAYKPRQKVNISLNTAGAGNKPVTGSFSVAVTDETNVPADENAEQTILSNLLLTSELRGAVEQPNYYFTNINDKTRADLDLLMLTQGYRNFTWKQVLNNTPAPVKYQPETDLTISGTVKRNGKTVQSAKVKLFTTMGGLFTRDTLTDVNGKFAFRNLEFPDGTKFVVQSHVEKGQDDVTLELDTVLPPAINIKRINKTGSYAVKTADTATYMLNQRRFYEEQQKYGVNKTAIILKEVKVADKRTPLVPHSQNLNGPGQADQVLTQADMDKMICGNIIDCLQGVLASVSFDRQHNKIISGRAMSDAMAIIIDGNFVEYGDFMFLQPADIEGIEVALGPRYGAIYGSRAAGGALIITTRRARRTDNMYYRYAPGVITYKPQGFYKAREFYSPQYDNPKTNQKMADLRSTIFWKPDIVPDKDGNASFSFFNADGKGSYRIVVEGIDTDGNLGRVVYRYNVE